MSKAPAAHHEHHRAAPSTRRATRPGCRTVSHGRTDSEHGHATHRPRHPTAVVTDGDRAPHTTRCPSVRGEQPQPRTTPCAGSHSRPPHTASRRTVSPGTPSTEERSGDHIGTPLRDPRPRRSALDASRASRARPPHCAAGQPAAAAPLLEAYSRKNCEWSSVAPTAAARASTPPAR